jgi:hypothetical protein
MEGLLPSGPISHDTPLTTLVSVFVELSEYTCECIVSQRCSSLYSMLLNIDRIGNSI